MLANYWLPEETDKLRRGQRLKQVLCDAIEAMRPDGMNDGVQSWWPYLIYTGEYVEGRARADIQRELAISRVTYTRAKQLGRTVVMALAPRFLGFAPVPSDQMHVADRFGAAIASAHQGAIASATGDLLNELHTTAQHAVTGAVTLLLGRIERLEQRLAALEVQRERTVGA